MTTDTFSHVDPVDPVSLIAELEDAGVELWEDNGRIRFRGPKGALTEAHRAVLRAAREQVIVALREAAAAGQVHPDPDGRYEPFPLTDVQSAYLLGRYDTSGLGEVGCHSFAEVHYPELDPQRAECAWNRLIGRHDMLRCVVSPDGYQQVLPEVDEYEIPVIDLREAPAAEQAPALAAVRAELDHKMSDPSSWPLFDLRITRTREDDILHISFDGLIADWSSAALLMRELEALVSDPGAELPEPAITFRDYVLAERRLRDGGRYRRDRRYWLDRVDSLPPAPELSYSPAGDWEPRFVRHHRRLPSPHWQALSRAAQRRSITPAGAVLGAYAAVLQRWSRRPAFTLNLTLLNRLDLHPDVRLLVGDFTSVSLLAVDDPGHSSFAAQAAALQSRLADDLGRRLFSGVEVLRELARRRGRDAAVMPVVFTSGIGVGPAAGTGAGRQGAGLTQTPQVTLDCQVTDDEDGLRIDLDTRAGALPDGLVADLADALLDLLTRLGEDTAWEEPVSGPDLVPLPQWQRTERQQANATAAPIGSAPLHAAVLDRASRTPDAPAVIFPEGALTYAELVGWAGRVSEQLREAGVQPGDSVGIVMDKGVEQIVAVLAVLLAGGVYLPIDTTSPLARRNRMLLAAGARVSLTQSRIEIDTSVTTPITVTAPHTVPRIADVIDAAHATAPDALAYVIFTSGSTGDPKGVMISHAAAWNTVADMNARFGVSAADRVLGVAQLGFDLSVFDIFGPLSVGGALVLPKAERRSDPSHWASLVAEHGVTLWNSVPAQMQMLVDHVQTRPDALGSLRLVLLSGDWIPVPLSERVRALAPESVLVALGGATEAAIWSIHYVVDRPVPAGAAGIPYGRPLSNQGFRAIDTAGRDAPVWAPGELCITGAGLARGYLNDPSLTAERFPDLDGERTYLTGDLGRYLPGGDIEFLGREDTQVKIRGHRIELGEVEAVLRDAPGVQDAVVTIARHPSGEGMLLGFAQPQPREPDLEAVRRYAEAVTRTVDRTAPQTEPEALARYVGSVRSAALGSLLSALQARGLFPAVGCRHTIDEIVETVHPAAQYRWLVRRWVDALVDNGVLERSGSGFTLVRRPDADWAQVAQSVRSGLCTQGLLDYQLACAEHLPQLLSGEASPSELLFPQGSDSDDPLEIAHAIYRDDITMRWLNQAVAVAAHRAAANRAAGGSVGSVGSVGSAGSAPVRVVEVGAGTGSTTESVLPVLAGFDVDYLFTDISPLLLSEAATRFGSRIRTARLDLNEDLREQGYAPATADIVIAAGVLGSTRDPADALARAVSMLMPGGVLVLTESVAPQPQILLTQGFLMTPHDGDLDNGEVPLLSAPEWRKTIAGADARLIAELSAPEPLGMTAFVLMAAPGLAPLRPDALIARLSENLPDYMVPAQIQVVPEIPLTRNGKVDRAALAGWAVSPTASLDAAADGPADELEERVAALWSGALRRDGLGRHDSFFDLGADSLIMARVAGRIREEIPEAEAVEFDVLLRTMLNEPTLAALCALIRTPMRPDPAPEASAAESAAEHGRRPAPARPEAGVRAEGSNALLVPFGDGGQGSLRVIFHAALGTLDTFQTLGGLLAEQRLGPVVGIAVADWDQYCAQDPAELVSRLADDYTDRLMSQPANQFQLVGHSLGGLLAVEVARRMLESGLPVADLTLIDSVPMLVSTDDELALEAVFVPNLRLDPGEVVLGGVDSADVFRAFMQIQEQSSGHVPAGALAEVGSDPGLDAVAAAFAERSAVPQERRLAAYAQAAAAKASTDVEPELVPALYRVFRHSLLGATVDLDPYLGSMTLLRASQRQSFGIISGMEDLAVPYWTRTCLGDLTVIDIDGHHLSCIEEPHVFRVAELLGRAVRAEQ